MYNKSDGKPKKENRSFSPQKKTLSGRKLLCDSIVETDAGGEERRMHKEERKKKALVYMQKCVKVTRNDIENVNCGFVYKNQWRLVKCYQYSYILSSRKTHKQSNSKNGIQSRISEKIPKLFIQN
jgi:hypothetical protein